MPSGSHIPFMTFKETGVQSVRTTLTEKEDEDVVSNFLSAPPRKYVSGFNTVTIPGNVHEGTSFLFSSLTASQRKLQFDIPDSCDVISDIYFNWQFDFITPNLRPHSFHMSKNFGYELIEKVEVRVANQLWQTLTGDDIFLRNTFEVPEELRSNTQVFHTSNDYRTTHITGVHDLLWNYARIGAQSASHFTGRVFQPQMGGASGTVNLRIFSGSGNRLNAFLQAAAPNNRMTVTVYLKEYKEDKPINLIINPTDPVSNKIFKTSLTVNTHLMTDTEKSYIKQNIINSIINTSQSVNLKIGTGLPTYDSNALQANRQYTFDVSLSDININTSNLLFTIISPKFGIHATTNVSDFNHTIIDNIASNVDNLNRDIFNLNLYDLETVYEDATNDLSSGLVDILSHAELFANGESVTGKIPVSYLTRYSPVSNRYDNLLPIYNMPLSSELFGEDSINFVKLHSPKLTLYFDAGKLFYNGSTTYTNNRAAHYINVTAIGTNVVTYVGGEANLQISN